MKAIATSPLMSALTLIATTLFAWRALGHPNPVSIYMRTIATFAGFTVLALGCESAYASSTSAELQLAAVAQIYREFSCEAVIEEPQLKSCSLITQSEKILQRHFSSQLAALILRDRRCVARTHEVCKLDFLPLWDSQDPSGATVKMHSGQASNTVVASVIYPSERHELTYQLVKTSVGWRISDINFGNSRPTLAQLLTSR